MNIDEFVRSWLSVISMVVTAVASAIAIVTIMIGVCVVMGFIIDRV